MKPFRLWMIKATTDQQERLAKTAKLSRGYLYQIADGIRDASSDAAGRIAACAEKIRLADKKSKLPRITRADISSICGACEYSKRCLQKR